MRSRFVVLALTSIAAACSGSHHDAGGDGGSNVDAAPVTPPGTTCGSPVNPVDTSTPDQVVGTGTAESCTEAALDTAIAAGGIITFACGASPASITVTSTLQLRTD